MGAKSFDPFNLSLLAEQRNIKALVMVHKDDLLNVHLIPNLLQMKQRGWMHFVTYENVFDIKHRNYTPILAKGGVMVPDDMVLLTMAPPTLESILQFMMQQSKIGVHWMMQVY